MIQVNNDAHLLSGLLRHLRRQAPAQGLPDHARVRRPSAVFRLRMPVHRHGPGAVPGGAGGDHPPRRGPGAVRQPGSGRGARRPRDHGARQTVHGAWMRRASSCEVLMGALPTRSNRRDRTRTAGLSAGAHGQRVRLLPAAVLLRMGGGRVRGERRTRSRARSSTSAWMRRPRALPEAADLPQSIHSRGRSRFRASGCG